ncbi:MAG: ribosome biogenesis GTP-binding protein YihA/YsxC [Burkholderiales bacterium]|jgi:GTP-binding protein|nr:ribosome biogenesis GTP-binding protein YihA/YsxC [Burkholderiales bacterium]
MSNTSIAPKSPPLLGATFVTSAAQWRQLPEPGPIEIAFAGRSNSGKSSAINALARRARLAFSSRTPGRTQQINFFVLRNDAYIVDLPGYGYAAVARETKNAWQEFLWRYVTERGTLAALVLLLDIRRGLTELDYPLLDVFLPSARPVLLLVTKADKLNRQERQKNLSAICKTLAEHYRASAEYAQTILFSARDKTGVAEADAIISHWMN